MGLIFVDDVIYIGADYVGSVMYFNGNIYHNSRASDKEIISELNTLFRDDNVLISQTALMSLIQKSMGAIKEKYC